MWYGVPCSHLPHVAAPRRRWPVVWVQRPHQPVTEKARTRRSSSSGARVPGRGLGRGGSQGVCCAGVLLCASSRASFSLSTVCAHSQQLITPSEMPHRTYAAVGSKSRSSFTSSCVSESPQRAWGKGRIKSQGASMPMPLSKGQGHCDGARSARLRDCSEREAAEVDGRGEAEHPPAHRPE